jgi:ABC-2 type transport system permease protein
MISRPISSLRMAALLIRLQLQRLWRRSFLRIFRKKDPHVRTPTSGKGSSGLGTILLVIIMLPSTLFYVCIMLDQLHSTFGTYVEEQSLVRSATGSSSPITNQLIPKRHVIVRRAPAPSSVISGSELRGLTAFMCLMMWICFCGELFLRDLTREDSDLEWISSLPIGSMGVFGYRMVMRTVPREADLVLLAVTSGCMAFNAGWGLKLLPLTAAVVGLLLGLMGSAHAVLEPFLRIWVSPDSRYYLQRMVMVLFSLTLTPLYFFFAVLGSKEYEGVLEPVLRLIREAPEGLLWTPPGLAVSALTASNPISSLRCLGLMGLYTVAAWFAGSLALRLVLARGITTSGLRESRRKTGSKAPSAASVRTPGSRWFLTPYQAHVIRGVAGRGSFPTRLPVILLLGIAIAKLWPQEGMEKLRQLCMDGLGTPARCGLLAFFVAPFLLPQTAILLHRDGPALWLLTTVPRSLESLLAEGCVLTAILAGAATAGAALIPLCLWLPLSLEAIGVMLYVIIVAALMSAILVYLVIPDSNPYSTVDSERMNQTSTALYGWLYQTYWLAVLSEDWWARFVNLVIGFMIFIAAKQRAVDEMPYFLDPVATPPRRITLLHGLIFTQFFFLGQIAVRVMAGNGSAAQSAEAVVGAYMLGGLVSCGLARWSFRKLAVEDAPVYGFKPNRASVAAGIRGAVFAAAVGVLYLRLMLYLGQGRHIIGLQGDAPMAIGLTFLMVIPDPIFEEYLFRGLVYTGLKHALGFRSAVLLSALTFAVVHPPFSFVPVFALGLCTALAYERTGTLLAPMIVHGLYNLTVSFLQLFA